MSTIDGRVRHDVTLLSDLDFHLFDEGTHAHLWQRLGGHPHSTDDGVEGVVFGVWAPNAAHVGVIALTRR